MKELNSLIRRDIKLKNYTTFRIGGKAKAFLVADNIELLKKAVMIDERKLILGFGSNMLISDNGFKGLVIAVRASNIAFRDSSFIVEAGASLPQLAKAYLEGGFSGLEWATGIPGSVGGALIMNAGAFGGSIGNIVESVDIFRDGKEVTLNVNECNFSYRSSGILSSDVILRTRLRAVHSDRIKLLELKNSYAERRRLTQPQGYSAGSIFLSADRPAGWYIDKAGLKGKRCGGAQISNKHANFIINVSNATAENVTALIDIIKAEVKVRFGVELKEEIKYVGFE